MGQAPLENESAQAGAEFRLGQGTGAWSATRNRPRFGCGIAMLAVGLAYGLPLVLFAPAKQVTAGICAPLAVAGAVMMAIPPRRWRDRLYCYEHGIAQYTDPQPEPDMLRWADLTWMTLRIGSGYEGDYISACGLSDHTDRTVVLAENRFGDAADVVTAAAEKLLAPVLAPVLIARYDAGEPVTCGPATIGPAGISSSGRPGKPWALAWQDMDIIETTMHGQRVTVTHDAGRKKRIQLDGEPNSFLARYLIAHAAARAGVAETSDPPLLPGII